MKYWIILSLLLLISCKTVKKDTVQREQKESAKIESTTKVRTNANQIFVKQRDIENELKSISLGETKIYPQGEFLLQSDGTFKGSADSIITKNSKRSESLKKESDSTTILSEKAIEVAEGVTQEINTELKARDKAVTRTPSLIPYLGVGLLLIAVIWFLVRKFYPSKN